MRFKLHFRSLMEECTQFERIEKEVVISGKQYKKYINDRATLDYIANALGATKEDRIEYIPDLVNQSHTFILYRKCMGTDHNRWEKYFSAFLKDMLVLRSGDIKCSFCLKTYYYYLSVQELIENRVICQYCELLTKIGGTWF